jgi:hypothetical protein
METTTESSTYFTNYKGWTLLLVTPSVVSPIYFMGAIERSRRKFQTEVQEDNELGSNFSIQFTSFY